jgi:hypothetical protein
MIWEGLYEHQPQPQPQHTTQRMHTSTLKLITNQPTNQPNLTLVQPTMVNGDNNDQTTTDQ